MLLMRTHFLHVHLLDTAIASDNVGDEIIVEACRTELAPLLKEAYVTTSSSHDGLGPLSRSLMASADVVFMLGTNALSQRRSRFRQSSHWPITRDDFSVLKGKVVLVGVGASRSYTSLQPRQRRFLRGLLSPRHVHSLRDESALKIVEAAGHRGLNTTCPTLWRWRGAQPNLSHEAAGEVCFTLTQHKPDAVQDGKMIDILRSRYQRLWFWPQQPRDLGYLDSLRGLDEIHVVAPNLAAYDTLLSRKVDVIGTRLHGTIRGLGHGCRSIVIGIDNRAKEIAAHTGLEVIDRSVLEDALPLAITRRSGATLEVDGAVIDRFLGQFRLRDVTSA